MSEAPSLQGHRRAYCGGFPASFLSVEGDRTAEVTFPGVTRVVRSSPGVRALTPRRLPRECQQLLGEAGDAGLCPRQKAWPGCPRL